MYTIVGKHMTIPFGTDHADHTGACTKKNETRENLKRVHSNIKKIVEVQTYMHHIAPFWCKSLPLPRSYVLGDAHITKLSVVASAHMESIRGSPG